MDGTGTYAVQFRDVFIPDDQVLAAPAMPFVKKIRAGFILMQIGMGLGLIRDCVAHDARASGRRCATSIATCRSSRRMLRRCSPRSKPKRMTLAATPFDDSHGLLAPRRRAAAARRRRRGGGGACGDAALRRARLSQIASRPAPAARGLFRRDRHPRHQAAPKDARRPCAREPARPRLTRPDSRAARDQHPSSTQWRLPQWLKS